MFDPNGGKATDTVSGSFDGGVVGNTFSRESGGMEGISPLSHVS
jgi:hypothetical protein